jgi:hypothetical protein
MSAAADVRPALIGHLKDLHLPTVRECYEDTARRAERETLSYEQYLLEVVTRECEQRRKSKVQRLLKDSALPLEKSLQTFDLKRLPPKATRQFMRPTSFRPDALRVLLLRNKIATLDDLKHALGTPVDVTVFRKLKPLDYLSSYSHRGRFYTLREIALFDDHGLWSQAEVWFSRFGTLLATAEAFVNRSPRGYFADELAPALHVEVQDALHQLAQQDRVSRQLVSGRYLYTATDPVIERRQLLTRRTVEFLPTVADTSVLEVAAEDVKAAILLFYSLLDEQQRRLYAGLESLKLGRSGDRQLADFLDLDPHTVARGRQQLLAQDVEIDGARKAGAGRKRVEKKRPK